MERDEIIRRIEIIIRGMLEPSAKIDLSSEIKSALNEVDEDDKPKLANLLEDLIVLLKDDPENRAGIKKLWNKITDGYGHISPISDVLASVKRSFLEDGVS
ncbi:MAG TPA: hypothetical protein VJR67_03445 [Candidatus Nitrosopolaris sp.]|jgi:hypothetical protein|nr:hypothetical protein [Candidatus Nitrosopolaris sp.]